MFLFRKLSKVKIFPEVAVHTKKATRGNINFIYVSCGAFGERRMPRNFEGYDLSCAEIDASLFEILIGSLLDAASPLIYRFFFFIFSRIS
jgi:hypothetical protein